VRSQPAEFLEAQHSCITSLALYIAPGARKRDSYPELVEKLTADQKIRDDLRRLGDWRNEVKHRDNRVLAVSVIDEATEIMWSTAYWLTGVYLEAVSPSVGALATDEQEPFKLPPMFTRQGEPRVTRR